MGPPALVLVSSWSRTVASKSGVLFSSLSLFVHFFSKETPLGQNKFDKPPQPPQAWTSIVSPINASLPSETSSLFRLFVTIFVVDSLPCCVHSSLDWSFAMVAYLPPAAALRSISHSIRPICPRFGISFSFSSVWSSVRSVRSFRPLSPPPTKPTVRPSVWLTVQLTKQTESLLKSVLFSVRSSTGFRLLHNRFLSVPLPEHSAVDHATDSAHSCHRLSVYTTFGLPFAGSSSSFVTLHVDTHTHTMTTQSIQTSRNNDRKKEQTRENFVGSRKDGPVPFIGLPLLSMWRTSLRSWRAPKLLTNQEKSNAFHLWQTSAEQRWQSRERSDEGLAKAYLIPLIGVSCFCRCPAWLVFWPVPADNRTHKTDDRKRTNGIAPGQGSNSLIKSNEEVKRQEWTVFAWNTHFCVNIWNW